MLTDDDYKRLNEKLTDAEIITLIAPPIILSGAAVGIAKDVAKILKLLVLTVEEVAEIAKQILEILGILLTDEEGSRALGMAMGAMKAQELVDATKESSVKFTYKLGELVGPTIVYAVLAICGGEIIEAIAGSTKLAAFLEKYPGIVKNIERIKAILPGSEGRQEGGGCRRCRRGRDTEAQAHAHAQAAGRGAESSAGRGAESSAGRGAESSACPGAETAGARRRAAGTGSRRPSLWRLSESPPFDSPVRACFASEASTARAAADGNGGRRCYREQRGFRRGCCACDGTNIRRGPHTARAGSSKTLAAKRRLGARVERWHETR